MKHVLSILMIGSTIMLISSCISIPQGTPPPGGSLPECFTLLGNADKARLPILGGSSPHTVSNLLEQVDELARISAVRNYKSDQIMKGIYSILNAFNLPAESITIVVLAENKVHLAVKCTAKSEYNGKPCGVTIDYIAEGKAL